MRLRSIIEPLYEWCLREQCLNIPNHIAVIQDGNRRFARMLGVDTANGHRAGADTSEMLLDWAHELGIRHITLYSFSTENFRRDEAEVRELFELFREMLRKIPNDERVHRYQIKVQILGDRSMLPPDLVELIEEAERVTSQYGDYAINVALAYGGRNEILHTAKAILAEVREGNLQADQIDAGVIESHLHDGMKLPPVDLIIRTGNEKRTSNFLPWLANGNESAVYFCAPYWPQFRKIDLLRAIRVYDQRVRMMG